MKFFIRYVCVFRKEGRKKGRLERDKTKIRTARRNNEVRRKKKGMNGRVNERRGKHYG